VSTNQGTGNENIAVLIISCDKYCDLWKPFFTLFFRYWTDCPFQLYLVTNHLCYNDRRVTCITVGDDHDWSSSLRKALKIIPSRFLIILLEDYLLNAAVDTHRILEYVKYMGSKHATCLQLFRFSPIIGPVRPSDDHPDIGYLDRGTPYRVSLQAAIWDKQDIDRLLQDGESAWQFEMEGTVRSALLDTPFLSLISWKKCPIPYFTTAVIGGKWQREAVKFCKRENVTVDLSVRGQRTLLESMYTRILIRSLISYRWTVHRVAFLKRWIYRI